MNKHIQKKGLFIGEAILTSYSQIFFTDNKKLASLLLVVSFIDWWVGLSGLIAVFTAIFLAEVLDYSPETTQKGLYSFNSLLVGLGVGTYFSPGIEVVLLVILGGAVAFFCTVFLIGFLSKYGLPFLSFPFLLGMWLLLLSFPSFTGIELNTEALYPSNMFFKLGGNALVSVVDFLNSIFLGTGLDTYFLSLGAIFFQFNILAGVLIAIGLLYHSRVHFFFSLAGFFVAYWFYYFLGIYTGSLNYTYYGFNFILSAIAIGGYFLIPSRQSLLWSLFLIPVLVITTIGSDKFLSFIGLSAFSLPFNIILIGILYALKIRYNQTKAPILTFIQQKNPETNAYLFDSQPAKKYVPYTFPIRLPVLGEWFVNQGHNGVYTHKEFFKDAWDFIIKDKTTNREYANEGLIVEDYYCFNKPVIAPASGAVVSIINNVEDNKIGVANTIDNWGNTIIIKHQDYLYSKLSHLKKDSIIVALGDIVVEGQIVGKCGNSGRSPYPHLHFQLQASPIIGSPTIFWPLFEYVQKAESSFQFIHKGIPKENSVVSNTINSQILQQAFSWNPGDQFTIEFTKNKGESEIYLIQNEIDIYNQSSLYCENTGARLYYVNSGKTFSTQNYIGSKKSPLFIFYTSFYKLVFNESSELVVETKFPIHYLYKFPLLTFQDFLVPFGIFLKGKYSLLYKQPEQVFSPQKLELKSRIIGNGNREVYTSSITIHKNRSINIDCETKNKSKINIKWESKQF